ncbi:hypothetical protein RM844_14790 [Streptomyces sp. DSM 44915]|uniref:Lipoprotein n=1 Tax=Streptomyces chisholmiae TaxID=3075540 RepID=A0ABU2JRE4_9ACTN|nr:hypothetical protein [Streptomyces sp. DSM 44915]MDT0267554.1 hypothetical protein [Streptomyces sp. DSM 44915]
MRANRNRRRGLAWATLTATALAALTACGSEAGPGAGADASGEPVRPALHGELEGIWLAGEGETAAILTINAGLVYYTQSQTGEGDTCEGTIDKGLIQLSSCEHNGGETFSQRSAHVLLQGDDLRVTWVSGEQQTYTPMLDETAGH